MSRRYNDFEVWEYLQALPSQIKQSLSNEGSHILQQVVNDWANRHPEVIKMYHVEWRRDPTLYENAKHISRP